jgi:hypothetical protein
MVLAEIFSRRSTLALTWLTLAAGAVYVFIFEPGKTGFFMVCPFRALTGFTCPGCGTTRGLHHLLHGDLWGAFQLNPFTMLLVPILLLAFLRYTIIVMRGQPFRGNQLAPKYIWLFFVVSLSFWIFRNTPWYPFVS